MLSRKFVPETLPKPFTFMDSENAQGGQFLIAIKSVSIFCIEIKALFSEQVVIFFVSENSLQANCCLKTL